MPFRLPWFSFVHLKVFSFWMLGQLLRPPPEAVQTHNLNYVIWIHPPFHPQWLHPRLQAPMAQEQDVVHAHSRPNVWTTTVPIVLNQQQHRPNAALRLATDIIMYITWVAGAANWRLRKYVAAPAGFVPKLPTPAGKGGSTPHSSEDGNAFDSVV